VFIEATDDGVVGDNWRTGAMCITDTSSYGLKVMQANLFSNTCWFHGTLLLITLKSWRYCLIMYLAWEAHYT